MPKSTINTVSCMHFCVGSLYKHDDLIGDFVLFRNVSTVSNTFNVYQAFNFRKIKNLVMVSARNCEINFILQVLLYTFKIYIFPCFVKF